MATLNTFADYYILPTEELSIIHWDWYKSVHNVRPRWVSPNDRQAFLDFIEYELRPETREIREQEYQEELAWFKHQEELDNLHKQEMREIQEVENSYDTTYFHIEESFRKGMDHRYF